MDETNMKLIAAYEARASRVRGNFSLFMTDTVNRLLSLDTPEHICVFAVSKRSADNAREAALRAHKDVTGGADSVRVRSHGGALHRIDFHVMNSRNLRGQGGDVIVLDSSVKYLKDADFMTRIIVPLMETDKVKLVMLDTDYRFLAECEYLS